MTTLLTVGLTAGTMLIYFAGWHLFQPYKGGIGHCIAWLLSPITVPLGLLAIILVG